MSTDVLDPTAPPLAVFDRSDELRDAAHEQVVFCHDKPTGLRAIIALHDTTLGPALGGTRYYPYANEALALTDVLRLSEGMTHKAAAAGMPLGGGKAVIIGDPSTERDRGTPRGLRALRRVLGGAVLHRRGRGYDVRGPRRHRPHHPPRGRQDGRGRRVGGQRLLRPRSASSRG